jgi:hypothetical protein
MIPRLSSGLYDAQRSNQSMKPTSPDEVNVKNVATTPCRGLSLSR